MFMKHITLKIITPERLLLEKEVDQVTLPISGGEITVLPDHESYIGALKSGEIMVRSGGQEFSFATSNGFVEFRNNVLSVLSDTAERAEDIDEERAEAARKRAEELKNQKFEDETEYAKIAVLIEKEMARIRVAKKHRTRNKMNLDGQVQ